MENIRKNFYIITGGPGSGKTSIINSLQNLGYLCVPEVGRQIIQEQTKIGGDAVHTQNQQKFCDLMLSRSIYTFDQIDERDKPVFFDRGIPELIGYCHLIKEEVPNYLLNAVKLYQYNRKIFILPPWREIYQHDDERKQSWEEAIETFDRVADSYIEAGYETIEVPAAPLRTRVEFILNRVDECAVRK